jgi:two-component system, OmpR family, response regulator CpxR
MNFLLEEKIKKMPLPAKDILVGVRILLVEDDPLVSGMYVRYFEYAGANIEVAFDGISGLERISSTRYGYNIVLLDLMMPRMNGYEMLKIVREKKELEHTPVIILTNLKDRPQDIEEIQELGVSDYLIKSDTNLQELLDKVQMFVVRERKSEM